MLPGHTMCSLHTLYLPSVHHFCTLYIYLHALEFFTYPLYALSATHMPFICPLHALSATPMLSICPLYALSATHML